MRKKNINQRTGAKRHIYVPDDYGKPNHMAYCGAKTNAVCLKCRYVARSIKHTVCISREALSSTKSPNKCPMCRSDLYDLGTKIKIPKKNKWLKLLRLCK